MLKSFLHNCISGFASGILILFSVTPLLAADSEVAYEAALVIPWKYVEHSFSSMEEKIQVGDIQFNFSDIPVTLSNVEFAVKFNLSPLKTEKNETYWATENLQLGIQSSGFRVSKEITQVIQGVEVVVRLEAQCSRISLFQEKASASMAWSWTTEEQDGQKQVRAELKDFDLAWLENSWVIEPVRCSGPAGFADLIEQALEESFSKPDYIKNLAKEYLEKGLNERLQASIEEIRKPLWLQEDLSPRRLQIEMNHFETITETGFLLRGILRVENPSGKPEILMPLFDDEAQFHSLLQAQVKDSPSLVVSKNSLSHLVKKLAPEKIVRTELHKVSAFHKLMRSRFMQFFLWPDLMKYPKHSEFDLVSKFKDSLSLDFQTDNKISIRGNLESWVLSNRSGKKWNYLYLNSQLSGQAQLTSGKGSIALSFDLHNLRTDYVLFPEYVERFNPSTYISVSTVDKGLKGSLSGAQFSWKLPELTFAPWGLKTQTLQAQEIKSLDNKYFLLEWKPKH